ncbi:MAG: hypothetical protein JEY79_01080 [Pseudodesulfovibrio sp.]|nr:hypothetical protein [Pseudodesulfovibrio sp.]
MSPDLVHQLETMLARIEERVKGIQDDIKEINLARRCHTHTEKIRTLERLVWGCLAGLTGLGMRLLYEILG